ncbi:MAG TPA: glycosyltransferase family 39 protein [Candidatus Eisenbacteria bacterium]|nr:glycosyltransferase family 39 protein [Candidatus Eisenbacteria bacterium]
MKKFQISNFKFQITKTYFLVILLIIVTSALRLFLVGHVPPSPDWDEAALGYNAYSILHTGRDEYGQFMPIVLRSFDDYKPALYSYLIIPSLFIFGLSIEAVRMPSILFGITTVVVVYFLCRDLFHNNKLSFLIALLLALSPWHIQFSRIGFESNVGLSLNIIGAYFFLKGMQKYYLLPLSVIAFVASLYVYQSEKVFVPLFVCLLIFISFNNIKKVSKKYLFSSILVGLILVMPLGFYLATNTNALARAKGVSVFSDTSNSTQTSLRVRQDKENHDYVGLLIDNRRVIYGKEIIANYLTHFDLRWLFLNGDVSRHHAPFMGLLYLWELPFLLIGIYCFLFSKYSLNTKIFIFGWFLLAPLPASVTTGVPHAVRTLNFLPTFQIFIAFGVFTVFEKLLRSTYHIAKIQIKYLVILFSFCIFLFNFIYFLDQYFVQQNYYNSLDWQYGYQEAIATISKLPAKHVIVSNQPPLDQSYMFFLFYLRYDPNLYQKETRFASGGFRENHSFGKYEFRPINWKDEKKDSNILYVGRPSDFSESTTALKRIEYLNNEGAIEIVRGE